MKEQHNFSSGLTPEESLAADNALRALNLELKHGAFVHLSDDAPPEILQQFLKNVEAFENQQSAPTTTVAKRIGLPTVPPPDLLPEEVHEEINRLQSMLEAQGILLIRPENVGDADFYHFIIADILPMEVPEQALPGMVSVFNYGEFYPDEKSMIELAVEMFLLDLLNMECSFREEQLSEECRTDNEAISRSQAIERILAFRSLYDSIAPVGFHPFELLQPGNGTYFTFGICWDGTVDGIKERHEGFGICQVFFEDNIWKIQGVSMPGFKF